VIYQFRAVLGELEPKTWRLFEVPGSYTVSDLSYVVMPIFRMNASRFFILNFKKKGGRKADEKHFMHTSYVGEILDDYWLDPTKHRLKEIASDTGAKFRLHYGYDDGGDEEDFWIVDILLKKIYTDPSVKKSSLPRVLDGEGYGILEKSGGPYALMEMVEDLQKKKGAGSRDAKNRPKEMKIGNIDLESFDLNEIDKISRTMPNKLKSDYGVD
jgi:hypothetical protein